MAAQQSRRNFTLGDCSGTASQPAARQGSKSCALEVEVGVGIAGDPLVALGPDDLQQVAADEVVEAGAAGQAVGWGGRLHSCRGP